MVENKKGINMENGMITLMNIATSKDIGERILLARDVATPKDILTTLSRDTSPFVRLAVFENENTTKVCRSSLEELVKHLEKPYGYPKLHISEIESHKVFNTPKGDVIVNLSWDNYEGEITLRAYFSASFVEWEQNWVEGSNFDSSELAYALNEEDLTEGTYNTTANDKWVDGLALEVKAFIKEWNSTNAKPSEDDAMESYFGR